MNRGQLAAARRLGKTAARLGKPVTACPYDPGGTPDEAAAARAWMNAYLHWRPPAIGAVDYDGDEDGDAE